MKSKITTATSGRGSGSLFWDHKSNRITSSPRERVGPERSVRLYSSESLWPVWFWNEPVTWDPTEEPPEPTDVLWTHIDLSVFTGLNHHGKTYCVRFVQVHTGQVQLNRGLEAEWNLESSCGLEVWEDPGADGSKTTQLPADPLLHFIPPTVPDLIPSFDDWTNRTGLNWSYTLTFSFFFFTQCVWGRRVNSWRLKTTSTFVSDENRTVKIHLSLFWKSSGILVSRLPVTWRVVQVIWSWAVRIW